ncbi:telomere length regulation protein TEL2 homolog [Lampris incognitus]|uniref:telomere length regulation protein TEL2 homolog n=1 Tax=Lampris incognitus TaxID=2546036 RepID=UPI0024B4CAE7|nr:telomere length regulation protein TEL2 homolog [Lampris incognitus]XP_056153117.1 telomere length regulation protein TEL2 homolog [Lampris incognitus]
MQSLTLEAEVRLEVSQCFRSLATSADNAERISALQKLATYLDNGAESPTSSAQRAEFGRTHYSRTLHLLIANISAEWLHALTAAQRTELWDGLFLHGPPEQALLVLMEGLGALSPSVGLDLLVSILETFLQSGRLAELLWSYCQGAGPSDSPQLRESLLGNLAALSDLTANRLYPHNKVLFLPQQYYPLLAREMLTALERTCQALRDGKDCSLTFVAQTLGKVCIQGHSELLFAVMAPRLSSCTRSDMVWQRVCWKLLEKVPERWLESVLTGLVLAVNGPEALSRIIGNLVLKNKKAQYVITYKLILLQYKYETRVLRILLGYLAMDPERRPLLIQVLRSVCQAWANPSAVRHTPLEQQLYVSRALLLCVSLLSDKELHELRPELLQCLLGGMQSHLDSSVLRIRHVGMVVGECLSSRMDATGTRLKFEYDHNEETRELLALMTPLVGENAGPEPDPEPVIAVNSSQEANGASLSLQDTLSQSNPEPQPPVTQPDSDLDSDDDLTPYDMSGDQEMSEARPPRYLRDCLEVLVSSEDPVRVELSLRAVEDLVRKNISTTREVSVQLTKVLLYMVDKYSIAGFLVLKQAAMVALAVTDCLPVVQYLTTEFYALNYSLRQRLDMLEVLAMSARELSQPIISKGGPSEGIATVTDLTPYPGDDPVHWRQVVERRIQSKTRRLSKGVTRPPAKVTPNRYAPVAGYFFFPLLHNYDRPQATFDLLGSDHLVLGRLIHTLGLLVHLAVNAPIASQMGCALLDFVWTVRYHVDQTVRRGVLFAVCSVFLSMPSHNLLQELGEQLLETRTWLADVAEGDPDADCRSLAVQSLVLLDKNLRKQLDPQAQTLQS